MRGYRYVLNITQEQTVAITTLQGRKSHWTPYATSSFHSQYPETVPKSSWYSWLCRKEWNSVTAKPPFGMNLQPSLPRTKAFTIIYIYVQYLCSIDGDCWQSIATYSQESKSATAFVGPGPLPFSTWQGLDEIPFSQDGGNQQDHQRAVATSLPSTNLRYTPYTL